MSEIQQKQDIRKMSVDQIKTWMSEHGEKAFRGKQIYEWLWKKSSNSFADMTNLSLATRQLMEQHFDIHKMEVAKQQQSNDGTIKSAFRLFDGNLVEGVLIPAADRMTACVSSQVGCSLTCKFCATGYMDRKRNLEAGEIYDQVVAIARQAEGSFKAPLTNIVYMGMGEPLLNYTNMMKSIEHITSPEGLNMSPRRITVSTAGIAKMIKKLGDDEVKFRLALSLHAANDVKRNQIMPINESNSLENLAEALNYFYKRQVTGLPLNTLSSITLMILCRTRRSFGSLPKGCRRVSISLNTIRLPRLTLPIPAQISSTSLPHSWKTGA